MSKRLRIALLTLFPVIPGVASPCCGYGDDSSGDSFGYSDSSSGGFGSSGYGSDSGPGSFGGSGSSWGSSGSGHGNDSGPGSFGSAGGWGSPSPGYESTGYGSNGGPGSFGGTDSAWGGTSLGYGPTESGADAGPGSFFGSGNSRGTSSPGYQPPGYGNDSGPGTFGGPAADSYGSAFPSGPQGGSGGMSSRGFGGPSPGNQPYGSSGGILTPGGAGTASGSRDFWYGDSAAVAGDGGSGSYGTGGPGQMDFGSIGEAMRGDGRGPTSSPGTMRSGSDSDFGYAAQREHTGSPEVGYSETRQDPGRSALGYSNDGRGTLDQPALDGSIGASLGRSDNDASSPTQGADHLGYRLQQPNPTLVHQPVGVETGDRSAATIGYRDHNSAMGHRGSGNRMTYSDWNYTSGGYRGDSGEQGVNDSHLLGYGNGVESFGYRNLTGSKLHITGGQSGGTFTGQSFNSHDDVSDFKLKATDVEYSVDKDGTGLRIGDIKFENLSAEEVENAFLDGELRTIVGRSNISTQELSYALRGIDTRSIQSAAQLRQVVVKAVYKKVKLRK